MTASLEILVILERAWRKVLTELDLDLDLDFVSLTGFAPFGFGFRFGFGFGFGFRFGFGFERVVTYVKQNMKKYRFYVNKQNRSFILVNF